MPGPYYDNVMWPGADGLRVPTEVLGAQGPGTPGATLAVFYELDIPNAAFSSNNVNLSPQQALASYVTVLAGLSADSTVTYPVCQPGQIIAVFNNLSANTVTFRVATGGGVTVAAGKRAILAMDAVEGDLVRLSPDT